MKVKVTLVTLFDADPPLLLLKEIFIVNPSPVARFEHVAPYVRLPSKTVDFKLVTLISRIQVD